MVQTHRSDILLSLASLSDSWSVPSLGLLVVLACTGLPERVHTVNLILGSDPAEVMDLADGAIHALLDLLEREAKEALATHELCLLSDRVFSGVVERGLPLCDADKHVFLGLVHGKDGSTFSALDCIDDSLRRWYVQAEDASKDVLAVESGKHCDVTADTDAHNEKFIGTTGHGLDLPLDDLLHVGIPL